MLGISFGEALGDKKGSRRSGTASVPRGGGGSRVAMRASGRPGLAYRVSYPRARIGSFDVDLVHEFFQGFVNTAQATLHIDNLQGTNAHHIAETIFKAFGRAARMAVAVDPRVGDNVPSTKGHL